jgi:glucokinase
MGLKMYAGIDLGGRFVRAVVLEYKGGELSLVSSAAARLAEVSNCTDLFQRLVEKGCPVDEAEVAVIGAAGIYREDSGVFDRTPRYPYPVSLPLLQQKFHWRLAYPINNFEADAYYLLSPQVSRAQLLFGAPAVPSPRGNMVITGPGSGLGLAGWLYSSDGQRVILRSESGHISFPLVDPEGQWPLIEYLKDTVGPNEIQMENILSGPGLVRLHDFLHEETLSPEMVGEKIRQGKSEAGKLFAYYLGLWLRTIALWVLPIGGIYLTGEVLMNNPELLNFPQLQEALLSSHVHREIIASFPVYFVKDEYAGAWGAALVAFRRDIQRHLT